MELSQVVDIEDLSHKNDVKIYWVSSCKLPSRKVRNISVGLGGLKLRRHILVIEPCQWNTLP